MLREQHPNRTLEVAPVLDHIYNVDLFGQFFASELEGLLLATVSAAEAVFGHTGEAPVAEVWQHV